MNHASFLTRMHECLDERRDPLDDAEVQAFLLEHPEHLAAIAELRACLHSIDRESLRAASAADRTMPNVRRRQHLVALAATAAVVALTLLLVRDRGADRPVSHVFTSTLRELAPRAHIAAAFEIRETLAASPSTRVSVYERRSEPR